MKRLVVVVNDLERSGKTSLARAVHHHLTSDCEIESLFVTSDENDLGESFVGEYWDLDEDMSSGSVIEALESHHAIVVDVHSGGARNWADFCQTENFDALLADIGAEMTLIVPNTGGVRCNEEIYDIVEAFSDSADYVVAHTNFEERDQMKWKGSEAEKATRYLGAIEVDIPQVGDDLETAMESAGQDLCGALTEPGDLPRFAEVQITQWLEEISNRLDGAAEYLQATDAELALEY